MKTEQGAAAIAKMIPTVRGEVLVYHHNEHEQVLTIGTADWYAWLQTASSFALLDAFTQRAQQEHYNDT